MKIFKRSPKMADMLSKRTKLTAILDVKTRWNSLVAMLQRFLKIKSEINVALASANMDILVSANQVKLIEKIVPTLEPILLAVKQLSAKDCNLLTADIILEEMISRISTQPGSSLKTKLLAALMTRILERRSVWSDIIFFFNKEVLKNPPNRFYCEPSKNVIYGYLSKLVKLIDAETNDVNNLTNGNSIALL